MSLASRCFSGQLRIFLVLGGWCFCCGNLRHHLQKGGKLCQGAEQGSYPAVWSRLVPAFHSALPPCWWVGFLAHCTCSRVVTQEDQSTWQTESRVLLEGGCAPWMPGWGRAQRRAPGLLPVYGSSSEHRPWLGGTWSPAVEGFVFCFEP